MLKAIVSISSVFWLWLPWQSAMAQVYFEGLHGSPSSAEGVSPGGMAHLNSGYVIWSGSYSQSRFSLWSFIVDYEGHMSEEILPGTPDSISEQPGNVFMVNDTMMVAFSHQRILSQPSFEQGDIVLTCLSPTGPVYWRQVYGLPDRTENPTRVIRCSDGGYAITGQVVLPQGQSGNGMMYLIRTDSLGNPLWERMYGGPLFDAGNDLIETPDGGFLQLGWTRSFGAGQRDWYLVKADSLGNQQWQRTYGDVNNQSGASIISVADGNYVMCGGAGGGKARMIKVNSGGEVIWQQDYDHPEGIGSNYLFSVVSLPDGTIAACGLTNNPIDKDAGWLVKTDSEGNELWQRKYNKNESVDLFYTMLATEDGGFLLGGQALNDETNSQDAWLLKVDSVGCAYPNCLVGVDELDSREVVVDVWPNPATDVLNVELQLQGGAEVHLYDMAGKLHLQKQMTQMRETIDVSTLQNGLYLLTVIQAASRTTVRIVVQH